MSAQQPEGQRVDPDAPEVFDVEAPRQILVIEDEEDLAELFAVWAREHFGNRVEIHQAHSIEEGRRQLQTLHRLDIVLLDRQFPKGSGDDLLDRITTGFDAIVVMITGMSPELDLIRLPITDYLVKPIDQETFTKRISLLEKLKMSDVLTKYSNARKASLLEYHLDDPEDHPLFRRFAAQWSYDRLEAIDTGEEILIYELYLGRSDGPDRDISVSIVGSLSGELSEAIQSGHMGAVGELVPSGEHYAWIDVHESGPIEPAEDGYVVYEFTTDRPEILLRADLRTAPSAVQTLETQLEGTYS